MITGPDVPPRVDCGEGEPGGTATRRRSGEASRDTRPELDVRTASSQLLDFSDSLTQLVVIHSDLRHWNAKVTVEHHLARREGARKCDDICKLVDVVVREDSTDGHLQPCPRCTMNVRACLGETARDTAKGFMGLSRGAMERDQQP
jgi:hypothetical protein